MPRTLLLPPRLTASAERVRDAAERQGLATVQLPSFEVPPGLTAHHLHAGPTFADAVAPALGLACLEAPVTWLADLPRDVVGRDITAMPIRNAWTLRHPAFVKSPNDKSLRAMVYTDGTRLPGGDAVDPDTLVLVSGVVAFEAEYRFHLLDGDVVASSRYAASGTMSLGPVPDGVLVTAGGLLADIAETLPSAIVIDLGLVDGRVVVIEANAAWASGAYDADVDRALDVVLRGARPAHEVPARDQPFVRKPA